MSLQEAQSGTGAVLAAACLTIAGLLLFAALLIYAVQAVNDSSGAKGQGAMVTCIAGAAASLAAAAMMRGLG